MLDAYAGNGTALARYQSAYNDWRELAHQLGEVSTSRRATEQEIDLLRHQVTEIAAAELADIDPEALETQYLSASQGQRISELCDQLLGLLSGRRDQVIPGISVLDGLQEIERHFQELERIDPQTTDLLAGIRSAHLELQEIEPAISRYAGEVALNPAELHALEERIHSIELLKRKYGQTIEEILAFHAKAAARLQLIEGNSGRLEELEAEVDASRKEVEKTGKALHKKRATAGPRLADEISRHLGDLGFHQNLFRVDLNSACAALFSGLDEVEFRFAPNPGEPEQALRQIASSGEMSRVMLAVKSALAKEDAIPLLVFDEIDANVGGGIASAVGEKMASLGAQHQVISITHLPQVAALADHHYHVSKQVQDGRTLSVLSPVSGDDRIDEIARMLGGASDSAVAHAMSLLGHERCLETSGPSGAAAIKSSTTPATPGKKFS